MIFVTVGSSQFPFDRLVMAADDLAEADEVVVQCGPSTVKLERARSVPFMPFAELAEHMRRASVVVTHAGVGSIMLALEAGRRPLVVPRRARYGEAVDDHQVQIANALAEHDRIAHVDDVAALRSLLEQVAGQGVPPSDSTSSLAEEVRAYAEAVMRRPA